MKISTMTAKQSTNAIQAVEARLSEIREWRTAHAPPKQHPPSSGPQPGRDFDALEGAGPEYRRIMLEGSPEEAAQMERERETLDAEAAQLSLRLDALRRRQRAARDEEHRAGAPARLKEARTALGPLLDSTEAAIREAREGLAVLADWLRAVDADRELLDDESRFLDPADLHRLGLLLRVRVEDRDTWRVSSGFGGEREVSALFASPEQGRRGVRLLGAPEEGWLTKMARFFGAGPEKRESHRRHAEREARAELDRRRLALLAAGDLEALGDDRAVAEAAATEGAPNERAREHRRELLTR